MDKKKKILLVSPFPDDAGMYPHLRAFMEELHQFYEIAYWYFPERGFLHAAALRNPFKKEFFGIIRHILRLLKHMLLLYQEKGKHDVVIAIDNFLYVLCDRIFTREKVILWSHDFVSYDQPKKQYLLQEKIAEITADALVRRGSIITQDNTRLALLLSSIPEREAPPAAAVFYLPVSLPLLSIEERNAAFRPTLMQLGYICRVRGSLELLQWYQTWHTSFELYLHGVIAPEFITALNAAEYLPIVSSVSVPAAKLHNIITKADIGFVFYRGEHDLNAFNARNASGQLVEFLRLGKPVIASGCSTLRDLMQEHDIGLFVDDIAEIGDAVTRIMKRYTHYSESCLRLFADDYVIHRCMRAFPKWLDGNSDFV